MPSCWMLVPCSLQDSIHMDISITVPSGDNGKPGIEDRDKGSRKIVAQSHGKTSTAPVRREIKAEKSPDELETTGSMRSSPLHHQDNKRQSCRSSFSTKYQQMNSNTQSERGIFGQGTGGDVTLGNALDTPG